MNEQDRERLYGIVIHSGLAAAYMARSWICSFTTIPNDLRQHPIFGHDHPLRSEMIELSMAGNSQPTIKNGIKGEIKLIEYLNSSIFSLQSSMDTPGFHIGIS